MFEWFKTNNNIIESYIKTVLKKNKFNVDFAYSEIYAKYPFFKRTILRNLVSEILSKQIKNENIGGVWRKVDKKWKLMADIEDTGSAAGYKWSGDELPASIDQNSASNNLGTYSKPIETKDPHIEYPKDKETPNLEEVDIQAMYEELYKSFSGYIKDNKALNEIILDELLSRGFGRLITRIKLHE
jgi:hypothetical protein